MKALMKILGGVAVVAILVSAGWWGYQTYLAPVPSTPTPTRIAEDAAAVISAEGRVVPVRDAQLAFQTGGVVSDVLVEEGDVVEAGDLLVTLDTAERQAAVDQALAALDAARAQRDLLPDEAEDAQEDLADAQIAQAEAALALARATLAQAELTAPFAGTITAVALELGEVAAPGVPVVVVADLTSWRVETLDLSEEDVLALRVGQRVEVRLPALEDEVFRGRIARIDLGASQYQGNVTYNVQIDLDAADAPLSWGMTAFVDVDPAQALAPGEALGAAPTASQRPAMATSTPVAGRPTATAQPTATSTQPPSTATERPATSTPRSTMTPTQRVHVVARGENLSRIAEQYEVTVNAILQANGLTSTTIVTGQRLIIP
ncbi:MAG TPA: efflux RND transporter periplasmic adaptor subunit [Anaerolineales bacterium]|nr:efflux RND transporter periplasmic adaptor subunit [Anaerolineales bacterium]